MYPPGPPSCAAYATNIRPPTSSIPNGANPAGTVESENEPTHVKVASYISTLLPTKSAANSMFPDVWLVTAKPVYTAPGLFTAISASLKFTDGTHPLIVPSSVAKMKTAGAPWIWKSCEPLNTRPEGMPGPDPLADGTATCRLCFTPALS